jgi:hypothetical protein
MEFLGGARKRVSLGMSLCVPILSIRGSTSVPCHAPNTRKILPSMRKKVFVLQRSSSVLVLASLPEMLWIWLEL